MRPKSDQYVVWVEQSNGVVKRAKRLFVGDPTLDDRVGGDGLDLTRPSLTACPLRIAPDRCRWRAIAAAS